MSANQFNHLGIKIGLQRALLLLEQIWHAAQLPLLALGVAVLVLASGIVDMLPKLMQVAVLAVLALGFLYSLKNVIRIRAASKLAAMRRMEQSSAIIHRELSSHDDGLVAEASDVQTRLLWEEHKRRQLGALDTVRLSPPKSAWRIFDPMALRVPVALAASAALLLGPGDLLTNARNAANLAPVVAAQALTVDAWIKPPTYTGKLPILLTSAAMREKLSANPDLTVPEGSALSIRVQGATKPHLEFYSPGAAASAETEIKSLKPEITETEQGYGVAVKLDRPVTVKLLDGTTELATWPVALVPDQAPRITFVEDPKPGPNGSLAVHWQASDDYGVKAITTEISLADEQEGGMGFESNGVFLYDPPIYKIALQKPGAKTEDTTTTQDLSAHAWAGLYVNMVLTATDASGRAASTPPRRIKLPERNFYRFLARSLIEQRKKLIDAPDEAPNVSTMLEAILAYPYNLRDQSRLVLQLAYVKAQLANAGETDDVKNVVDQLWTLAVAIEDGEMADVRAQLRDLKQQLEQALKDGAPPERIAELTDKMRKAMDKLLDQMRKEAEKRAADGTLKQDPNSKSISRDDLQKMLDSIEEMNKGGSKDAAQDMLSQLDQLLQNLQPGASGQASKDGDSGLQQKLDGLSDLMRRQQQLMDQTQKLPQPGEGEASPDKPDQGSGGLADRQGNLSDMLDRLNKELGADGEGVLGDASKSMKGAKGALKDGEKGDALQQQGEAMRQMQDGAQKLGKKLAERGEGQSGQNGKDGEAGGNKDDPLGRPRASHNPDTGPNKNMVPSELQMRRAREILEGLRQRYDDPNLGSGERAYIDRLLRGLY